jgi:hypothetical protein
MKCLSRVEVQEFIDKEVDSTTENEVLKHLEGCNNCLSIYNEALKDRALINNFFNNTIAEENVETVPEFKLPGKRRKRIIYFRFAVVLAAATLIGFIFLIRFDRKSVTEKIPDAEMLMYEFYDGKDLNKLWHDKSQILIIQDEKGNVIQSIITN